jgi:hypothetical protein
MNWHTDDTWVDEYVDGTMGADAMRAVEGHVAMCASCRALVADLRTLRTLAESLGTHAPAPHVWARISAGMHTPPRRGLFSLGMLGLQPAGAVAATLLLATALWWVAARLTPTIPVAAPVIAAGVGSVPVQMAEAQFTDAIAGLEQMTVARQDALDPETIGVVQANLSVIDAAIDQSRQVLRAEPDSRIAQESLFRALRSKVAVLQDILALINEMRMGDADGAARIVSGLNQ